MNNEKKWIIRELEKKDFTFGDTLRAVETWRVVHTDYGGFTEDEIVFHIGADGRVSITGDNDSVCLQPEQVDVLLKMLLEERNKNGEE